MFNYFSQKYKNPEEDLFDNHSEIERLATLKDELLDIEIDIENLKYSQSNLIDLMAHLYKADYIDYNLADKFISELGRKICTINDEIATLTAQHKQKANEVKQSILRF